MIVDRGQPTGSIARVDVGRFNGQKFDRHPLGLTNPDSQKRRTGPRAGARPGAHTWNMIEPVSPRRRALQQWTARWNGPIFSLLGLIWLVTIPFSTGSSNVTIIRCVIGIGFVVSGLGTTVIYLRDRRREHLKAKAPTEAIDSDALD